MSLCWNCGYDREGVAQPAMFVDVAPTGITACTRCRYDLQGNPEATRCPECGEPVPWADCERCGARASRWLMADGCPACRATAAGVAFIPEVELKVYTHCPECQYDLRGLPEGSDCPECGRQVAQGVYETVEVPTLLKPDTLAARKRIRRFWGRLLVIMLFGMVPVAMLTVFLSETASETGAVVFCVSWGLGLFVCMIRFVTALDPTTNRDTVDRHTR